MTLFQPVVITRPGQEYAATKVFKDRGKAVAHAEKLRMEAEVGQDRDARTRIDILFLKHETLVS